MKRWVVGFVALVLAGVGPVQAAIVYSLVSPTNGTVVTGTITTNGDIGQL
jgi:hypothetical protein